MAWIQDEAAASLVEDFLADARRGHRPASWSIINTGEVFYQLRRRQGEQAAEEFWSDLFSGQLPIQPFGATNSRVRSAARIKADQPVSYADAFAIALALELEQPLVTGDLEIRNAAGELGLALEWLG